MSNPSENAAPQENGAPENTANSGRKSSSQRNRRGRGNKASGGAPWSVAQFEVPEEAGKTRFHDLDLDERLMHGIADAGFKYCSPIQAASLPHTLRGNDVIGKAQTGTGKTAAFLITIFNDLLANPIEEERYAGEPRALIIAPTRELVVQIGDDARQLGKHCGLNVVTLIGGMDYQKQLDRLASDLVDIVVATPGRLLDFENRRDIYLDQVELLVIDEADRMLDMGFIPQVKRIVRSTPKKTHRQTLLFSATFTEDIIRLTEQWTLDPVRVEIEPESVATDTVDQKVYLVESQDKFKVLRNIVQQKDAKSVIVFANRRDETRRLFERLCKSGIKCGILSGEIPQNKRSRTLQQFKDGEIACLVATDVAGRGIHVDGVSHVVNYTLPEEPEDYVHRIGRTGRAGATGTSISFACEDDAFLLPAIEAELGMKLNCEQPPEELLG
ncbi:ATP-dependent RNA helicase RhlB [Spongiibacter taiwanensis]|uniref:ATP-dependent RNA helicase RhlB n=1 Tax=Spongiibacter taiwanensis TaxID=1748242 RepID=UPI0020354FB1|nr:ATP-dependent RNA helicase RhlB [Spongiibacter taiwanensis]